MKKSDYFMKYLHLGLAINQFIWKAIISWTQ
jgi:hypothetical protein